ncbi:MAG: TraB/GumN family protein [Pseudomonadota bacterium]
MPFKSLAVSALAVFSLATAGPALAQEEAQEHASDQSSKAPSQGPALWKVADEDTTIYLFGTVHALPNGVEWYDEAIANALSSSDTLVTEIGLEPGRENAAQEIMMEKALLADGVTLRSLLDDDQTAQYETALAGLGLPAEAFDRFEPWMASITLTMLPLFQQGYSPDTGVEQILIRKARDKSRDALETAEFQVSVFDELPQDKQITLLMETVEGVDEIKPLIDKMVVEWIEGDADALAELMNEGLSDPELAEVLLYNRNANWAEWIDQRLDTTPGTVFIAVGAGHLAGEKSVQDLLEDRDIEVERLQ